MNIDNCEFFCYYIFRLFVYGKYRIIGYVKNIADTNQLHNKRSKIRKNGIMKNMNLLLKLQVFCMVIRLSVIAVTVRRSVTDIPAHTDVLLISTDTASAQKQ